MIDRILTKFYNSERHIVLRKGVCKVDHRDISQAVISRLPRYYRYLGDLRDNGVERISSQELSAMMHVTASQIRQDFNHFGGFGQQGYGYNVAYLYEEIGKILGLDRSHSMVLIGGGNLGSALVNYMNYRNRGFYFRAIFDEKESLIGTKIGGVEVHDINELHSYLMRNAVDIVVLTIPKQAAQKVADDIVDTPIRAFWNFAHTDLRVPAHIKVENVHLSESLMRLSYNIHQDEELQES